MTGLHALKERTEMTGRRKLPEQPEFAITIIILRRDMRLSDSGLCDATAEGI